MKIIDLDTYRKKDGPRGPSDELADRIMEAIHDWQATTTLTDDDGVKELMAPVMAMSGLVGFFVWLAGKRVDDGFRNGLHVSAIAGMQHVIDMCAEEEEDDP
ncbi:MAG: hypothetical protein J2P48_07600 [Alphaproteobacteria bacterium]|nr:hypothetical protein [Alphaproteobacteria bacterium]